LVVQRHHGRTLHLDFRLNRDGVFKSWCPRACRKLTVPRLALRVGDHSLNLDSPPRAWVADPQATAPR
jgi:hypothetical protein